MDDLVQWLDARLDEDERIARAAASRQPGGERWSFADMQVRAGDGALVAKHTWVDEGAHIAAHDPARVLRDIDAKRQIIALHTVSEELPEFEGKSGTITYCPICPTDDGECPTLRLLALPYAARPGYRDEWRP